VGDTVSSNLTKREKIKIKRRKRKDKHENKNNIYLMFGTDLLIMKGSGGHNFH
jgi:hypothetical protein